MADVIDMANERAQLELDAAIAALTGGISTAESALYCEECDEQIPEKRRELIRGCTHCVQCQGINEQRQKAFR